MLNLCFRTETSDVTATRKDVLTKAPAKRNASPDEYVVFD